MGKPQLAWWKIASYQLVCNTCSKRIGDCDSDDDNDDSDVLNGYQSNYKSKVILGLTKCESYIQEGKNVGNQLLPTVSASPNN